ncbi:succinate--CoA ligase subunit alpha [Carboxydochorda subterranea]|uniref:Succinate--CoA ligase [ADP-forming] subunit alpha n=1 Tax=Carboxydichorda subterranea TaxID=3109565 RepID=A0ABZ1BWU6_9FIRM|nr:succinate--CoA ligase subunit alpha [Limnochorda sp. L945t]WRP17100.1 succinate--CoA ligase subunit alpha [Limnochorda sp. L945t]
MSILVDRNTRVVVHGITGREGEFHTRQMLAYGTKVVAGVTPGKGGTRVEGVPVFETAAQARKATGANASIIFVPAAFAADSALEAIEAGMNPVVVITEGIPVQDMLAVVAAARRRGTRLIGPNCPGLISPGEALVGILPGAIFRPGPVGLVSRSGTLTYEVVHELSRAGLGQSTCVGVGGDPIIGSRFVDILHLFEQDPATRAVVLIGEIGGTDEEEAAAFIRDHGTKPVVSFISGRTAPPGKRMGHAGAIISGKMGTAQSKVEALRDAGVPVADSIQEIVGLVAERLSSPARARS